METAKEKTQVFLREQSTPLSFFCLSKIYADGMLLQQLADGASLRSRPLFF
jgi:hypothetical protein